MRSNNAVGKAIFTLHYKFALPGHLAVEIHVQGFLIFIVTVLSQADDPMRRIAGISICREHSLY